MTTNISIFNGISPKGGKDIKVIDALNRIKEGSSKELINKIRENKANKLSLPAVTFCGSFGEFRSKENLKQGSGLAILDFDKISDPDGFRDELFKVEFVYASWVSPSGTGVKALIRIPEVESDDEYKLYYRAILDNFSDADQSTSDISRLCFESYDPNIRIRDFEKTSIFDDKSEEVISTVPIYKEPISTEHSELFSKLVNGISMSKTYEEGNRNNFLFLVASSCNEFGIPIEEATELMSIRFSDLFSDEPGNCNSTIRSAYSKKAQFGTRTLNQIDTDSVIASLNGKPIEVAPPSKVEFPLHVFPNEIQYLIEELWNVNQYPIDYSAASFISAIAGSVGNRYKMDVNGIGWKTAPIIWHAIVGSPGSMKSHPVKYFLKPLYDYEKEKMKEYSYKYELWRLYDELPTKKQKDAYRNEHGVDATIKPIPKELISVSSTIESLTDVLKNNPLGITVHKDELISLTKSMGQYKSRGGDDEQVYLSFFNGDTYKITRKGQEMVFLNDTFVGVIGTIQPNILEQLPSDNGFLQRFLFTHSSSDIPLFSFDSIDESLTDSYNDKMRNLIEYTRSSDDETFQIDRRLFKEGYDYLTNQALKDGLSPEQREYYGKLKTYLPRLIIVLIVAWETFADVTEEANPDELVMDLIRYYENTGMDVFKERSDYFNNKRVFSAIERKGLSKSESAVEAFRKGVLQRDIAGWLKVSVRQVKNYISDSKAVGKKGK